MMPFSLTLVRHMESEGNVATHASMNGDDSYYTPEFRAKHSREWRLSERGRGQAPTVGAWIRKNVRETFDRYLVSDYLRACESAGLLGLPDAKWRRDINLRERDWGEADVLTHRERLARFGDIFARKAANSYLWSPPNGEAMPHVVARAKDNLGTLHRECSDGHVLIMSHGEVMWAYRMLLELLTMEDWNRLDASKDPFDHIYNGQVIQYTRVNPTDPTDVRKRFEWTRSVCPTDLSLSSNVWRPIVRRTYSNEELLASLERATLPAVPVATIE